MNITKFATVVAAAFLLSACASITRGTHEVLEIETDPSGADVALSNGESCVTPCGLKLKRKHGLHVSIKKDGYETIEADVLTQISGSGAAGMAGNVLLGGIIGGGIDASNGSLNEFVPNPLKVTLVPLGEEATAAAPIIAAGESFHFKTFAENGIKVPLDKKERKAYLAANKDADEDAAEVAVADTKDAAGEAEAGIEAVAADAEALAEISSGAGGEIDEAEVVAGEMETAATEAGEMETAATEAGGEE